MVEQSPSHSKTYFKMFSSKNARLLGPALKNLLPSSSLTWRSPDTGVGGGKSMKGLDRKEDKEAKRGPHGEKGASF